MNNSAKLNAVQGGGHRQPSNSTSGSVPLRESLPRALQVGGTEMFATLLVMANNTSNTQKLPRSSNRKIDGWGNVYKRKYLVAVQMKKAERILGTWVNLKTVLKKEKEVKTAVVKQSICMNF